MRAGLCGVLGVALLTGYGAPHPTGGGSPANPRDVASVQLFNSGLGDLTFHIPLFPGDTLRVEVRMYPEELRLFYGSRTPVGLMVYVQVRPTFDRRKV